jgi:hypothetical protein
MVVIASRSMSSGREHAASTYVSCLAGQAPCHCRKSRTAAHALQTRTTPNTFTPRESAHSAPGPAPDRGRLGGVPVYRRLNLSKGFTSAAGKRAGGSMAGNAPTPEQESRGLRRHASAHSGFVLSVRHARSSRFAKEVGSGRIRACQTSHQFSKAKSLA